MNTIPDAELEKLVDAVDESVRFAWSGRISAGFQSLYEGQLYAEALADDGEAWAEALAEQYRDLADLYTKRWGDRLVEQTSR